MPRYRSVTDPDRNTPKSIQAVISLSSEPEEMPKVSTLNLPEIEELLVQQEARSREALEIVLQELRKTIVERNKQTLEKRFDSAVQASK